jgi:hypothetical protein
MRTECGKARYGIFAENDGSVPRWVKRTDDLEQAIATVESLAAGDGQAYFVFDLREWQTVFVVAECALIESA